MIEMRKYNNLGSRGQVLLLVVIVMVVVLTVGLSIASRTITNLKLSKQDEDSQKAFQAASAGIDRYINTASGTQTTGTLVSSTFDTNISSVGGGNVRALILNNNEKVDQDRGVDVWLSTYPDFTAPYNGSLIVSWGTPDQTDCSQNAGEKTVPAIELLVLTGPRTAPALQKYVYDGCATRQLSNGFTAVTAANRVVAGTTFRYTVTLTPITLGGLIMKVIPIYNSTKVAIEGTPTGSSNGFPPQGKLIESVGTSGDAKRKIIYYESYPQIPNEIFPYAILSQ